VDFYEFWNVGWTDRFRERVCILKENFYKKRVGIILNIFLNSHLSEGVSVIYIRYKGGGAS